MRDIVFRPETTLQRIVPFDDETLRSAFAVRAGDVPEIDASQLEADIEEVGNKRRKRVRLDSSGACARMRIVLTRTTAGSPSASVSTPVRAAASACRRHR